MVGPENVQCTQNTKENIGFDLDLSITSHALRIMKLRFHLGMFKLNSSLSSGCYVLSKQGKQCWWFNYAIRHHNNVGSVYKTLLIMWGHSEQGVECWVPEYWPSSYSSLHWGTVGVHHLFVVWAPSLQPYRPPRSVTGIALLYGEGLCFLWGTNWNVSTATSSQYLPINCEPTV
jgi:hypothetical protein